jgi:DnaK suppressor protein
VKAGAHPAKGAVKAKAVPPAKGAVKAKAVPPAKGATSVKVAKAITFAKTAKGAPPAKAAKVAKPTKAARRAKIKEFQAFRAILVERQRELMTAYNLSRGDRRVHPDSGTEDYIDYAVSSYTKEFLLSLSEMDRKQLLLVKEALDRVDRGEYGSCQQCSEEISRRRLEVAPWARYCVRCQDLEEQGLLPQYPTRGDSDDSENEDAEEPAATELEEETEAEEPEELEEEPLGVGEEAREEADEE